MSVIAAGTTRAFLVGLVVAVAVPAVALGFVQLTSGGHFSSALLFLRPLAGAYPVSAIAHFPVWLAAALTLLQMAVLSAALARFTRRFLLREQVIAAVIALGLLALVGDLVYTILDIEVSGSPFAWE
jgi:hypothetical protein